MSAVEQSHRRIGDRGQRRREVRIPNRGPRPSERRQPSFKRRHLLLFEGHEAAADPGLEALAREGRPRPLTTFAATVGGKQDTGQRAGSTGNRNLPGNVSIYYEGDSVRAMPRRALIAIPAVLLTVACGSSLSRSVESSLELGVQAARRGYWQEAEFRFQRAALAAPTDSEILNNLAVAQEALGRYDDALQTYKKALQNDPRNTAIRRNYARFAEFYTSYARGVRPKRDLDANR